jgi:GABA permease
MAEAGVEQRGGGGRQEGHLQPGLKRRHMTMIAIGGIIGAGLFVGTGPILNQAGPATILTYLLTGTILILVMRMLGEMAVAQPSVGSFSDYSRMALGNWAGFSVGWLYWYFWAIVVGFEATVAAGILGLYIPGIPPWLISLFLILLLTATNLYSVGSYGEFEFWFAGIKVAAIIIFITLAILFVIGLLPGGGMGLSNLYAHGGFFPNGGLVMFSGVVTVIFAFVGAEIVTIAAAESNEPERGVARATNQVIYRVLLFYVGSVFFLAAVVPWDTKFSADAVLKSPFTIAFQKMGIPFAPDLMNFVVLTAVLSVLFALTRHNDAPGFFTNTTRRGVPMWAILAGTSFAYISVVIYYFFPEEIFTWLINASGAIALFVYLLIAISELVMRRRLERDAPERLQLRMWLYPWLTYLSIAAMASVLVAMAVIPEQRPLLVASVISAAVMLVAYLLRRQFGPPEKSPEEVAER